MMQKENQPLIYRYHLEKTDSPFWAFAIHDGHHVDPDVQAYMSIDEETRLREEDPYTAILAELPFNRFISATSRFQLDINRSKQESVYLTPRQAWGLQVWKEELPPELLEQLYMCYDDVFAGIKDEIKNTIDRHGFFVVYDIHSYNARRDGPQAAIDHQNNPQINIGTAHNHSKWDDLTALFVQSLEKKSGGAAAYDVRENVKFKGGHLSRYLNERYGDKGCIFSIEFRKDFMDEWTGQLYPERLQEYKQLLLHTIEPLENYFAREKEVARRPAY